MGSIQKSISDTIEKLRRLGCEVTRPGSGSHYRVTYDGTFVGALGTSPKSEIGLDHSVRKIGHRIRLLKETGRTW